MNESDTSEPKTRKPAQQAHQPQPVPAPHNAHAFPGKSGKDEDRASCRRGDETGGGDAAPRAPLDDARFAAGVVKLYEALLKEPIPEDMLRLVEKIGKQERK